MNWPGHLDYIEAIQHPRFCFRDERLAAAETLCDRFGVPLAASGNFACVFRVKEGDENVRAVRCFTRPVSDHAKRYAEIAAFIRGARNPGLVPLDYREDGILVRGKWYPVVVMDWVKGATLRTFVESHLEDAAALRRLRDSWGSLAAKLKRRKVAHGDIQHGNVLVTGDQRIVLVDYDAMYLPAFHGQDSPELGHTNWQHPGRGRRDFHHGIDTFASLVLTTSLSALAADPSLWERFHNGENLLFTRADFESPGDSGLFKQLKDSRDAEVSVPARKLELACRGRLPRPRTSLLSTLSRLKIPSRQPLPAPAIISPAPEATPAVAVSPITPAPGVVSELVTRAEPEPAEAAAGRVPGGGDSWWRGQIPPPKPSRPPESESESEREFEPKVEQSPLPEKAFVVAKAFASAFRKRVPVAIVNKLLGERERRDYIALVSSGLEQWQDWLASQPRSFFKRAFAAMAIMDVLLFFFVF